MSDDVYARRFLQERLRLGYDQEHVGKSCGYSWQAVYNWELGRNRPSFASQVQLARIGYDMGFIFTGKRARKGVDMPVECA